MPGVGTGADQGMHFPTGIGLNPAGAYVASFVDSNTVFHAFVRAPNGAITTIDVPGAGSVPVSFQGTQSYGINPAGAITGWYADASNVNHGFVRSPLGAITTFEAPGAGTSDGQGTFGASVNPSGAIAGFYVDANNVSHGFVRSPDGRFTVLDAPGAGTGAYQGTIAAANNPAGLVTGFYVDANNASCGARASIPRPGVGAAASRFMAKDRRWRCLPASPPTVGYGEGISGCRCSGGDAWATTFWRAQD